MKRWSVKLFDGAMNVFLSGEHQERLARHILNRNLGEGNDDMQSNGEFRLLEAVKMQLRGRESIIFDVGANTGEWSRKAAAGMDCALTIYAFEPSLPAFQRLVESSEQRLAPAKFFAENVALSDAEGLVELYLAGEAAGTNSLYRRRIQAIGAAGSGVETVRSIRGDAYCAKHSIGRIDFLKVDTEGHEMKVLYGFREMVSEGRIDWIQVEYGGTWLDSRTFLADLFDFLKPANYRLAKILPRTIKFYDSYDQNLDNFNYANYVACRPELAPAAL